MGRCGHTHVCTGWSASGRLVSSATSPEGFSVFVEFPSASRLSVDLPTGDRREAPPPTAI